MKQLSEHFSETEFRCRCCSQMHQDGMYPHLIDVLEHIRALAGDVPVRVVSGYRCKRHNTAVGGARSSQHMNGTACDMQVKGVSPLDLARIAEQVMPAGGGIGLYDSFLHVDVRRNRARWDKRTHTGDLAPWNDPEFMADADAYAAAAPVVDALEVLHKADVDAAQIMEAAQAHADKIIKEAEAVLADAKEQAQQMHAAATAAAEQRIADAKKGAELLLADAKAKTGKNKK